MNGWGLISFGAVAALVALFFWVMVMPNGPTGVGVVMTFVFTGAAVVLILVGCIAAGTQMGRKSD